MVQVSKDGGYSAYNSLRQFLLQRQADASSTSKGPGKSSEQTGGSAKGREIHDTIELSGGGKIVNIARGYDLAKQVRAEKDPEKVRELIKQGTNDIERIGRLFREVFVTLRSVFRWR